MMDCLNDRIDYSFVSHVSKPNDVLAFVNELSSKMESNQDFILLEEVLNNFDWLVEFMTLNPVISEELQW